MAKTNHGKGIFFILLSVLFFGLNTVASKSLTEISAYEKIFFMAIFALIIMSTNMIINKKTFLSKRLSLLLLRAVFGFSSTVFYFFAIDKIHLNDATLLNKTSPFFVTALSVMWLKEKVNSKQIMAIVIAVIGTMFVIKPSFNYSMIPALMAVLSGALAGFAYVIVRKLKDHDGPETIVFYFLLVSATFSLPLMIYEGFVMPSNIKVWLTLIAMGFFISLGQMCLSIAYRYEDASKISIYAFGQIILSVAFGLIFFNEIPDWASILGGAIIFYAGYLNYKGNLELINNKG